MRTITGNLVMKFRPGQMVRLQCETGANDLGEITYGPDSKGKYEVKLLLVEDIPSKSFTASKEVNVYSKNMVNACHFCLKAIVGPVKFCSVCRMAAYCDEQAMSEE